MMTKRHSTRVQAPLFYFLFFLISPNDILREIFYLNWKYTKIQIFWILEDFPVIHPFFIFFEWFFLTNSLELLYRPHFSHEKNIMQAEFNVWMVWLWSGPLGFVRSKRPALWDV